MDNYSLSLLAFLGFIAVTITIRIREKTWFSPAAMFSLVWMVVIGFSLLSAHRYYFSPGALLFILSIITVFFAGGQLIKEKSTSEQAADPAFFNTINTI